MAKEFVIAEKSFWKLVKDQNPESYQKILNTYIEDQILEVLKGFSDLKVFALGSLGLKLLCPYSDVDLLVMGPEKTTLSFSKVLEQKLRNLKIRYCDLDLIQEKNWRSWFDEMQVFDHYALSFARALNPKDRAFMQDVLKQHQKVWVTENSLDYKKDVLKERQQRFARYGHVAGLLQPNLKYGRGGLRDITQALGWLRWAEKCFHPEIYQELTARLVQDYEFLSSVRFATHLLHCADYISMEMWEDFKPRYLNYASALELQKKIYKTLNEVRIKNDYIFAKQKSNELSPLVTSLESDIKNLDFILLKKKLLQNDLNEEEVLLLRWCLQQKGLDSLSAEQSLQLWSILDEVFFKPLSIDLCQKLFDSYLLPSLLPHWKSIEGRPQAGHYHQYTVDEHLLKTLQAVCSIENNDINLYRLSKFRLESDSEDWRLLKWTSLFHDLAKGLPGDHSEIGEQILTHEIQNPSWSQNFQDNLGRMVKYHLLLSRSAFRHDHNDAENLQAIHEKLKTLKFFKLLSLFTAADIQASNPEAWNEWKSEQFYLLSESFQAYVNNGQVKSYVDIQGFHVLTSLLQVLSENYLANDIKSLQEKEAQVVNVISHQESLWVRLYAKDVGPGVLVKMLNLFFNAGLSIEQAFICGHKSESFAYNWFRLPSYTSKTPSEITKLLTTLLGNPSNETINNPVCFESIRCVSDFDGEWVFLFKGLDQKGLLLRVSQVFSDLGLNILKAQVNTWGEAVEDIFVIEQTPGHKLENILEVLVQNLVDNYWH